MKEVETISIEHGAESGLFIDSDMVQEKGTITLHYLYDDTYCYYRVGHVHNKDAVSTSVEYDSFEDMAEHLRYWSNGMGELHCHGKREITQDDLPETLKYVYQELWNSDAGCPEYIVEYDGEYYLAVFGEYVTDTYLDALSRAEKLMYRNKGCCVVSCKTDANDYELYFLIPAETEKSEFNRLEKEAVTALLG